MPSTTPPGVLDGRFRSVALFAGCDDEQLSSVLRRSAVVTADAGEVLVAEGDLSDFAYVLGVGRASVTKQGRELTSLAAGDFFGETAMVAGGRRAATVRATTAVQLLRLDAESLGELTGTQTIAWTLLRSLLERIRGDEERDRTTPPAREAAVADDVVTAGPLGEDLGVAERVIVAPRVGVFHPYPRDTAGEGAMVAPGDVIGFVEALGERADVRSPFAGLLMGMLALDGERVRTTQPIAWLRTF